MRFLSLRACFLAAFVVAMPILALPPVAQRIDEWLYGPPPNDFGRAPSALDGSVLSASARLDFVPPDSTASHVAPAGSSLADSNAPGNNVTSSAAASSSPGRISPASFLEPAPPPSASALAAMPPGSPARPPTTPPSGAPPLPALPAAAPFERPPSAAPAAHGTAIDERTISRLQQIRLRLEQLGAEYVVVETLEAAGRYRFHARMLIDERSRFTRPFEASDPDPVAAGEQVLREVETWRRGGTTPIAR